MLKPCKTFVKGAITVALTLAGLPLFGQIINGSHKAPPVDLAQRAAAARAQFPSVLAKALSPENVKATVEMFAKQALSPASGVPITNFDNVSAPCDFVETSALRGQEQFADLVAPDNNGGAILNECAGFGIDALSPPNFLAFNNELTYDDGGIPDLPEQIFVGEGKTSVSLYVSAGSNPSYPIAMVAFGSSGVIGVVTTETGDSWVQLSITGTGIDGVLLVGNPYTLLVDNIEAE